MEDDLNFFKNEDYLNFPKMEDNHIFEKMEDLKKRQPPLPLNIEWTVTIGTLQSPTALYAQLLAKILVCVVM